MNKRILILLLVSNILAACSTKQEQKSHADLVQEIINVEKEFCDLTAEKGMHVSFPFYADEKAAIKRGDHLIIGKGEIIKAYKPDGTKDSVSLVWKPDFVDVSLSGDMAYTYGKYTYSFKDSLGDFQEFKGIFHTVWKRQKNGEWKFVYD